MNGGNFISEALKIYNSESFQKIWKDPVWSKVIAAAILAIISGIISVFIWLKINDYIRDVFVYTVSFINHYIHYDFLNIFIKIFLLLIIAIVFFIPLRKIYKRFSSRYIVRDEPDFIPILRDHPTRIFAQKLAFAFPDLPQGLKWFEKPTEAAHRLKMVLQKPLKFIREENGIEYYTTPIWLYRGDGNLAIPSFKIIDKALCLLDNHYELNIDKIAVFISNNMYHNFIYVETRPLKKTGLYGKKFENIDLKDRGYYFEQYAIFANRFISMDDYSNGSTIVNGKVIPVIDAETRLRYVSKYNFIISTQRSVYNTNYFDLYADDFLNGILSGERNYDQLMAFMKACRDNYDPLAKRPDPWEEFLD